MNDCYKRIMLFGSPGSGKSTFAVRLHEVTGIPLYHIDQHFFEANWQPRNFLDFLEIQQQIVLNDMWIIDGNSIKSLEIRYQRADICLYFNMPRYLCYWRVFKRFLTQKRIESRPEGCPESLSWPFLKYIWTLNKRIQKDITYLKKKYTQVEFVEIRTDRDARVTFHSIITKNEKSSIST